ncbi:MAG: proline--tRNA ligase, partial [Elusimicrobiota bacterium]
MRFSRAFIVTQREDPSGEADAVSSRLLLRAGFTRKVAAGIYEWLPLGLRVLKKVEQIIREEMNAVSGQEVWLPIVQPKELWQQSGRWGIYGKELLRFKDRKDTEFCLSPTAEEVVTDLVAHHITSWRQLPQMLYQFSTKFRDEARPRFGLLRGREFYMKDGYSFHAGEQDAQEYYLQMQKAYVRVFERLGFKYRMVEAETGPIGGSFSHEFMVLAETGEDMLAHCPECRYSANLERAECAPRSAADDKKSVAAIEELATPGHSSVDAVAAFTGLPSSTFIKTMFYWTPQKSPVVCLVRGDHEVNEPKLKRFLKVDDLIKMEEPDYVRISGSPVGFAGPQGLRERLASFNGARLLADHAVAAIAGGVSGANKKDVHVKNLSHGRDFTVEAFGDFHVAAAGDICPRCQKSAFVFQKGIEVGHIFKLGVKYSKAFNASYLDTEGKPQLMVMGCYGIGVSRIVAAVIEQNHDEMGMIWPKAIAPMSVHLIGVEAFDEQV